MIENTLTPELVEMIVSHSIGSFAIGWGIATLFKTFKQFGEKI